MLDFRFAIISQDPKALQLFGSACECGTVAVTSSTSLPADWRHAATPKHTVNVNAVASSSTDKNWLTSAPVN